MKDRMRKVTATRHQNTQNAYTYLRTTPEVFFGTAARSSLGQLNTQKLTTQKGFSYADALRSGESRKRSADPSTVTKHSGIYDGHRAAKYDGTHVIHENDHANTGSKPEHGVTATCR